MIISADEVESTLRKIVTVKDENSLKFLKDLILTTNASESFIEHALGSVQYNGEPFKQGDFILVHTSCLGKCNWFSENDVKIILENTSVYDNYFVASYHEYLGVHRAYRHKAEFANSKIAELTNSKLFYFEDTHLIK